RYVHSSFDISEKWDKAFGYSYGINSMVIHHSGEYRTNNIQSMNNRVLDAIVKTNNLLRSAEVINYSDRFIFVKDIAGTVDRLQELGLGRSLGKATVLSAEKGRVLFLMNNSKSGTILSQDADLSGMKGDRTVFEQEVICEFGRLAMMDRSAALNFLWSMAKGFADGRIPKEKLVYVSEHVQQDYFNYSAPAQLRERIATYIKYGVMKGDRFGYGYGKEKTPRLHIGSSNKGRIIKIPEFFSKNVEVEKEMYLDRWYGPKTKNGRSFSRGTVGDFVYAAFPVTSEEDRRELAKIVEGRRDAKIGKFFQEQLNLF
ncbi:MAG: hypothetical protein QW112_02920, partial [Candidatus Micrarchaeia archaeon]